MPFVGLGLVAPAPRHGRSEAVPIWSYGIGARLPLDEQLMLQLEMRERIPFSGPGAVTELGIDRGWEQRIGLASPFRGAGEFWNSR